MFVLLIGDPVTGVWACGPFEDQDEAIAHAAKEFDRVNAWPVEVEKPE